MPNSSLLGSLCDVQYVLTHQFFFLCLCCHHSQMVVISSGDISRPRRTTRWRCQYYPKSWVMYQLFSIIIQFLKLSSSPSALHIEDMFSSQSVCCWIGQFTSPCLSYTAAVHHLGPPASLLLLWLADCSWRLLLLPYHPSSWTGF